MVPNRPLLYLSLPSLAIIFGLIWYRRKRNIICDTGGKNKITEKETTLIGEEDLIKNKLVNGLSEQREFKHSKSVPIAQNTGNNSLENNNQKESKLGKSAPIDIVPNNRSPPIQLTDKQIDLEILKVRIRDSEYKNLRSIEEQEDLELPESLSPIDLPDSFDRRRFSFSPKTVKMDLTEETVIVKATKSAKITPENSFIETKYQEECIEQNSNERDSANHSPIDNDIHNDDNEDEDVEQLSGNNNNISSTQLEENHITNGGNNNTANNKNNSNINNNNNNNNTKQDLQRNPPIASPPLSLCSLRSTDSGKGSSPPHSEGQPPTLYEFVIAQNLVGNLIGRKGSFIQQIKTMTGSNIVVKKHPNSKKICICSIEGTQLEIDAALDIIRSKFPEKRFPYLSLERVYFTPVNGVVQISSLESSCLRLNLIEGINNDVCISTIINGGHIFVQQPLHPSFPALSILQQCMTQTYSFGDTPKLPEQIEDAICCVPINGIWYRVQVVSYNQESQTCLVKYLDFGGYFSINTKELRQIRVEYMSVPFQATECLLHNIKPAGSEEWSSEAGIILNSLTQGLMLQAQVAGYSTDGLPEIYLYAALASNNVVFINQELVARGLAEWVEEPESIPT